MASLSIAHTDMHGYAQLGPDFTYQSLDLTESIALTSSNNLSF